MLVYATTKKQNLVKKLSIAIILVILTSTQAFSAPKTIYRIPADGNTYIFSQVNAEKSKYFWKIQGNVYYYMCLGAPIEDTDYNRRLIMLAIKPTYINNSTVIDWDGIIPHTNRGFCVPSKAGASFAIDFISEKGFIRELVVGSSINCEFLK
jgi:hypothetical protein